MAQQTALDWLIDQINNKVIAGGWSDSQITISISKDLIEEAKQREIEQAIQHFYNGIKDESKRTEFRMKLNKNEK